MLKYQLMKRSVFTIAQLQVSALFLLLSFSGYAQSPPPTYAWGKGITAGNAGSAYHVAMDKALYVAREVQVGRFTDTLQAGGNTLYDGGMYINYSDTNGTVLWTVKEGLNYGANIYGHSCPSPLDVEMMPNGDVVVLGTLCNDSANFFNASLVLPSHSYFVAKYSALGVFQWVKTYNVKNNTYRYGTLESSLYSGPQNYLFVAFTYADTITMNIGTFSGSASNNAVLFALDTMGNEKWVQNLPGQSVVPKDILAIYQQKVYLLADYNSLTTPQGTLATSNSAIIEVMAATGSVVSVKPIADFIGASGQFFESNAIDISYVTKKLALCGRYYGNVAIGSDTFNTTANGNDKNVWVAQIDTAINSPFSWARTISAPGQDYAHDVIGHGNNVVVAGSLGLGGGHFAGDTIGAGSFIASYSATGAEQWVLKQPAGNAAYIDDIKPNSPYPDANIYVGGGIAFQGLFGNDLIANPALFTNTVSQVSYLAKTGPPLVCNGFAAVAGSGDTLISCQSSQQLVATQSNPNYSSAWSPAQYLDSANATFVNVIEQVHMQTFTFTATDNTNGCVYKDSLTVGVYLPHFDTILSCNNSAVTLNLGPGASDYNWSPWSPLKTQTVQTNVPGSYVAVATYPYPVANCGSLTSMFTVIDSCPPLPNDSVWPGDANHDGVADLYDVLNIGIGYNISGPVRTNGSTVWVGQGAQDWNLAFLSGLNLKHADCDGDGHIDSLDVDVVSLNYGLTHLKTEGSQRQPGNPPLTITFTVDTTYAPSLVTANISLGDVNLPVTNGYGVAFSLLFDNTLVDSSSIQTDFNGSWLGNGGNPQSLTKNLFGQGQLDMAHTRTTHTSISGYGHIGTVSFYIQDNIIGKDYAAYFFGLEVTGSLLISDDETVIDLDEVSDSVLVLDEFVGIDELRASDIGIYPNPGTGLFYIAIPASYSTVGVSVINLIGEAVYSSTLDNKAATLIDLSQQANGVYLVRIQTENGTVVKRITKQ